jgi:predicted MFS family arabinose efflux permease
VAPLLESVYGLSRDGVTGMLLLFWLGAVAGNAMGGRLTDRIGSRRTLVLLCLAQCLLMPALTLPTWPLAVMGALVFTWSVYGWNGFRHAIPRHEWWTRALTRMHNGCLPKRCRVSRRWVTGGGRGEPRRSAR